MKSVTQTRAEIFAPTFMFFMSEAEWAEIDPADQDAITAVPGEAFTELASKAWVVAAAAKGIDGQAALDFYRTTMNELTAY